MSEVSNSNITYFWKEAGGIYLNTVGKLKSSVEQGRSAHLFRIFSGDYIEQEAHGPHRSPELTAVNMYM